MIPENVLPTTCTRPFGPSLLNKLIDWLIDWTVDDAARQVDLYNMAIYFASVRCYWIINWTSKWRTVNWQTLPESTRQPSKTLSTEAVCPSTRRRPCGSKNRRRGTARRTCRQRPRPKPGASPFVQGRCARTSLSSLPGSAVHDARRTRRRREKKQPCRSWLAALRVNLFVDRPVKRLKRTEILRVIRRTRQVIFWSQFHWRVTSRHWHSFTSLPCAMHFFDTAFNRALFVFLQSS